MAAAAPIVSQPSRPAVNLIQKPEDIQMKQPAATATPSPLEGVERVVVCQLVEAVEAATGLLSLGC